MTIAGGNFDVSRKFVTVVFETSCTKKTPLTVNFRFNSIHFGFNSNPILFVNMVSYASGPSFS